MAEGQGGGQDNEEHVEVGGKKVEIKPRTLETVKKLEKGDIGQTSSQDLDAVRRAAEAKRRIEKMQRSGG